MKTLIILTLLTLVLISQVEASQETTYSITMAYNNNSYLPITTGNITINISTTNNTNCDGDLYSKTFINQLNRYGEAHLTITTNKSFNEGTFACAKLDYYGGELLARPVLDMGGNGEIDADDVVTATPSNGDTTSLSTADQIWDWVTGFGYLTTTPNIFNQTLNTSSSPTFNNLFLTGNISAKGGNFSGNTTSQDFIIPNMTGNNGIYSINHFFNDFTSAGRLSGGEITAGAGTSVDVATGEGLLRDLDDDHSQVRFYKWDALNIDTDTDTITYIGVDLNGGTPIVVNYSDETNFDLDTSFPLGSVINQAGEVYILNNPWWAGDGLTNVIERFQSQGWLVRDENAGGLILGSTGTRNPTMSAGTLWGRINEHEIHSFEAPTDDFDYYYRDGSGGWTENSDETQWSVTLYDDGDGTLGTINNNQYAVIWVWVNVASEEIALMYPQNTYSNSASAEAESIPSNFPSMWYKGGIIIGRIIIQEGQDAPVQIDTVFEQTFSASQASDHGNLAGLGDDDHTQYLLIDGTRSMTGNLLPNADFALNLGSAILNWANGYIGNLFTNNIIATNATIINLNATNITTGNITMFMDNGVYKIDNNENTKICIGNTSQPICN